MYEKILVPLDGSKLAEQVFPYVAELAKAFDSQVILIGVCEPEETEYGQACRLYIGSEADVLKSVIKDSAVKFQTVVLMGNADKKILEYAEENEVSLIAMTSHGRSGIMPWSLGGTVTKVLYKVGVPLILVRAKEKPLKAVKAGLFSRILVPLDGSEGGAAVLPYVSEMVRKMGAEAILLQVVEAGKHVHTIGGLNYVRFEDQYIDRKKTEVLKYLDKTVAELATARGNVRSEVRVGDGAREIIKFANEANCSLIAISSHGHSGIEAWIYGSITYKILQASAQSVLLVPSPGARR